MSLYHKLQKAYIDGFKAKALLHVAERAMHSNKFLTAQRANARSKNILNIYGLTSEDAVYSAFWSSPLRSLMFEQGMKEADRREITRRQRHQDIGMIVTE